MKLQGIYNPILKDLKTVETRLRTMRHSENEALAEAIAKILRAGGKRLRPALVLFAARACGYSGERAIRLAIAIELIHTASLIHDDVIDHAQHRRGTPTLNSLWGNKTSILAGDHVYSEVIRLLAEDGDIDILRCVAAAACTMTDSEAMQSLLRKNTHVSEDQYLTVIAGKTASLLSCACRVGSMLGHIHDGEIETLSNYGLNLGMTFQITDDLLDIVGSTRDLGKPVGNDIREGNVTLPFIHTMRVADEGDRQWLADTFASREIDESILKRMRDMARDYGGIQYTLEKARKYAVTCRSCLDSLPESDSRTALTALADHVLKRVDF